MDEYCAVCAEPIQFAGYGPCGHKEACSKCVVRLRVVLNDLRCVICQQEHDTVFITKYMGDFTQTLPAAAFSELPVSVSLCWKPHVQWIQMRCSRHSCGVQGRERRKELYLLRDANAYFDDEEHFSHLRHALLLFGKFGKSCQGATER